MGQKLSVETKAANGLNIPMLLLQCIGIVAVVFGHADIGGGDIPNFLNYAFPYYSWHMPVFIFISGYFFNRTLPAGKYIVKKLRTHLLPAFVINAVFGVFSYCLLRFDLASYGKEITLESLFITPFTTGYQFSIDVSLWFVFALVVIEVLSCLMDRLVKGKADWIYLVVTLAVSLFCCHRAFFDHEGTREEYLNAGLRLGFLMFFFWLGVCYRRYIEKWVRPVLNIAWSLVLFVLQAVVLGWTQYGITYNTRNMDFTDLTVPGGFWVAVAAPLTALIFFLGIAYSLAPYVGECRTLQTFGRNTKYVVYYHQFILILCSMALGALIKQGWIPPVPGFSFERLYKSRYYVGGNPAIACVIAVIATILPVMVFRRVDKQKWYVAAAIYTGLTVAVIAALYLMGKAIH